MAKTGLIALDLDGTLLNTSKEISARNAEALRKAAEEGVQIVPCTGRLYSAIPEPVKKLVFVEYVIAANGAWVMRTSEREPFLKAEIPNESALALMTFMDSLPVIYDCYMDGEAWISEGDIPKVDYYVVDPHYKKMVRDLRKPVPDLKRFIKERGGGIMKTQCFFRDREARAGMIREIATRFPDAAVSSSIPNNIEINDIHADKGIALLSLAEALGIPRDGTAAFGDGLNDIPMIRAAGIGIAMGNADEEVKRAADRIADHCDADGVAKMVGELLGWE